MSPQDSSPSPIAPNRPLPEHLHRHKQTGQWRERTLIELARDQAAAAPNTLAVADGKVALDFATIVTDAGALACSLHELGLRTGDRICFQVPNWSETAIINLALAMAGLIAVPIVPIYRDAEMRAMLADSGSRAVIITEAFRGFDYAAMMDRISPDLPALDHVIQLRSSRAGVLEYDDLVGAGRGRSANLVPLSPDAAKILLYTSGTTGPAKGVLHSQNTLNSVLDMCIRHWGIKPTETILMPSPVTHLTGFGFLELPFLVGSSTRLVDKWDAREAVGLIEENQAVGTVSATPFLKELVDAAEAAGTQLPSMRFFACGGAAVPPDLIRRANRLFGRAVAFRIFGCTEAPLVSMGFLGEDQAEFAATTDGQVKDYEVRILDELGQVLGRDEEGEIAVRGPAMMLGYLDPAQTEEAIDREGFYRTGDLGILTPEDAVVVTGRKKDLIIRGGENISAKEVEDVLHRHLDVADAAVVSMPHSRLGETVCAFVVTRSGAACDFKALTEFVAAAGLARQKIPERIEHLAELPRTPTGKIRKDLLREKARHFG